VSLCEVEGPHWVTVEGRGVRRWRRGPCWRRAPVCRPLPSASRESSTRGDSGADDASHGSSAVGYRFGDPM